MEIVGIGTEIVECVRIGRMIAAHGEQFLATAFTPKEIRHCRKRRNPTQHFAALWAAKEAILKAIGMVAARGIAWTDLEIIHQRGRRATVQVHGLIEEHARARKVDKILVSMAQCRMYATAYALALMQPATSSRP